MVWKAIEPGVYQRQRDYGIISYVVKVFLRSKVWALMTYPTLEQARKARKSLQERKHKILETSDLPVIPERIVPNSVEKFLGPS
jgi:hypothetical protein